jgi:hypothetical protein
MIDVSAVICIIVLLYSVICYMPFVTTVTVDRKKSLKSTRYLLFPNGVEKVTNKQYGGT